jgi:hypothetical protein
MVAMVTVGAGANYVLIGVALRTQLSEQLKSLEQRLEGQLGVVGELGEYFKKRGEIETEVGKMLDKSHKKELIARSNSR